MNNTAQEKFSRNEISHNGTSVAVSHGQSSCDPRGREILVRGSEIHKYIHLFNKRLISAHFMKALCNVRNTM